MADASPKTSVLFPISLTDKSKLAALLLAKPVRDLSPIATIFVPSRLVLSSCNCVRIYLTIEELNIFQSPLSVVETMNKCF